MQDWPGILEREKSLRDGLLGGLICAAIIGLYHAGSGEMEWRMILSRVLLALACPICSVTLTGDLAIADRAGAPWALTRWGMGLSQWVQLTVSLLLIDGDTAVGPVWMLATLGVGLVIGLWGAFGASLWKAPPRGREVRLRSGPALWLALGLGALWAPLVLALAALGTGVTWLVVVSISMLALAAPVIRRDAATRVLLPGLVIAGFLLGR